jgi:patatin-related protein
MSRGRAVISADNDRSGNEEVRLAMAWNGGVSLAIWMGGVAVELDTARRAHIGPQQDEDAERSLYNALTTAFKRELVIDILAGASAGGINGALLGAVITKGRELRPAFLRDRWLELGDLSSLLRPINESKPSSLMRGDYFRDQIRKAFRAVTGEDGADKEWLDQTAPRQRELLPGEVLLDVQATNVLGMERGFWDEWQQTLYAREYRAPIRFRHPDDYTSDALAAAARASASFPAAFEPSALMNNSARLAGFPGVKRWAIDGGLLENAPIRPAIELIPTRYADRPVTRFVCYVNAAPARHRADEDDPDQPKLREVLANVVNLPREGRFIDQLVAIEDATNRTKAVAEVATGLLGLDRRHLRATARVLLDAYRTPRETQSLREVLSSADGSPASAATIERVVNALDARDKQLPWMPRTLKPPAQASEWRWGLRPAQRMLLLQLDVLRAPRDGEDPVERSERAARLLEYREPLNKALARLEDARQRFASSKPIREAAQRLAAASRRADGTFDQLLDELDSLLVGFRCEAYDAVRRGAQTLYKALTEGGAPLPKGVSLADLFGSTTSDKFEDEHFSDFLERALCIEVIRRAFAPDRELEATQDLHFVQITPLAPSRYFAGNPLRDEGPNTGDEKLTGLGLAHFSAFYRRSWRANDFMWGRLDGATRIVDLLVSTTRARQLGLAQDSSPEGPLGGLVKALVPDGKGAHARDLRRLAKEALDDAHLEHRARYEHQTLSQDERKLVRGQPARRLADAVAKGATSAAPKEGDVDGLRKLLAATLARDLADPDSDAFFTRVVCARAAQQEIVRQELEPLALATARDGQLGCFTKPIPYDKHGGVLGPARKLVKTETLPRRLGSGVPDESTSTLAVRTISHAVLVLISSLKTAGVPLGGTFGYLRAPFLSLAGVTAQKIHYRAAALLAFVAGSFYVTARAVKAEPGSPALSSIWSPPTLATIVAALGVVALVALPLWRARRAKLWRRRIRQGLWGTAMLLASGLAALVAATLAFGLDNAVTGYDNPLTKEGGFALSTKLASAVIAVPVGAALLVKYLRLPSFGLRRLENWASRPGATALATGIVASLVIYRSLDPLDDFVGVRTALLGWADADNWRALWNVLWPISELWDAMKLNWRDAAVIGAYASVPLAGLYGLHGFVRTFLDTTYVRGRALSRRTMPWARRKLGRDKDQREMRPA